MKKLRHIIGFLFKIVSALTVLALLLSCLSIYINPAKIWIPAFFGLFFLPLFFINVIFGVAWIIVRSKFAWLSGCILLPSLFYLPLFIQFNSANPAPDAPHSIKVISYNVHLFGLLGNEKDMITLPEIAEFIQKENPDVICMQEVSAYDTLSINKAFRQYPYSRYNIQYRKNGVFVGIVTFSRYPIVKSGTFVFKKTTNGGLFTDISIKQKTVRVYNNHLQSTHLNLEKTALRLQQEDLRNEELRNVTQRLKTGFIKRAEQVNRITTHIASSPFPIIVCGDFNDTPVSYTYRKMKGALNDCFAEAGHGLVSTFRGLQPALRIDYIFSDKQFKVNRYTIEKVEHSDHYPVIVELDVANH